MNKFKKIIKNSFEYNDNVFKVKNLIDSDKSKNNNLIVLTSINPTKYGEGKTTTLIGLVDLFNFNRTKALGCLRQPSIGPYLGMKGGATGGGNCSLKNDKFINLGLTGDFDKISLVNNLILSIIENDIFQKNMDIDIKTIKWRRCIDLNDRSLREINYKINGKQLTSSFTITSASDIMALFSLCKDWEDFKIKLENTPICKTKKGKFIFIKDLKIIDSIKDIILNALNPNIVFTKYGNPIIMHGGPFANIAHGTNSLISTKYAIDNSEYTFVESGFGSDLGLEKFVNIVSRVGDLKPKLAIYAISYSSLKEHGENNFDKMINYLKKHTSISEKLNINYVVFLNKFPFDDETELNNFKKLANKQNIELIISDLYSKPLKESKHIFEYLKNKIDKINNNNLTYTYNIQDKTSSKIKKIATNIYNAKSVQYSKRAAKILSDIENLKYYVCIAKDHKEIIPRNGILKIDDIYVNHSANLIVPICSNIFLMPGLPKKPRARK